MGKARLEAFSANLHLLVWLVPGRAFEKIQHPG